MDYILHRVSNYLRDDSHMLFLINITLTAASISGVFIAGTSCFMERRLQIDGTYLALCDLTNTYTCSSIVGADYGNSFGLMIKTIFPNFNIKLGNGCVGVVIYLIIFLTGLYDTLFIARVQMVVALFAAFLSVKLVYFQYLLNSFCLICVVSYVINIIMILTVYEKVVFMKQKHTELEFEKLTKAKLRIARKLAKKNH